ncbi:hypothetical protein B0H11DRAFT_2427692 [Mycena galericulata]|nr:hypothetical protein B0H11DRAFT_2427692 [Mycena galericulata]
MPERLEAMQNNRAASIRLYPKLNLPQLRRGKHMPFKPPQTVKRRVRPRLMPVGKPPMPWSTCIVGHAGCSRKARKEANVLESIYLQSKGGSRARGGGCTSKGLALLHPNARSIDGWGVAARYTKVMHCTISDAREDVNPGLIVAGDHSGEGPAKADDALLASQGVPVAATVSLDHNVFGNARASGGFERVSEEVSVLKSTDTERRYWELSPSELGAHGHCSLQCRSRVRIIHRKYTRLSRPGALQAGQEVVGIMVWHPVCLFQARYVLHVGSKAGRVAGWRGETRGEWTKSIAKGRLQHRLREGEGFSGVFGCRCGELACAGGWRVGGVDMRTGGNLSKRSVLYKPSKSGGGGRASDDDDDLDDVLGRILEAGTHYVWAQRFVVRLIRWLCSQIYHADCLLTPLAPNIKCGIQPGDSTRP